MTALDPRTMIWMSTLMCGVLSIVMLAIHRSFRAEVSGLGHWALGLLLLVAGSLLFGLRGTWPDPIVLLGANAFMLCGICLSLIGTQLFYGRKPSWRLLGAAWAGALAGLAWWLLVTPNFALRVVLFSVLTAAIYTAQALLVARHGERHFSSYFFGLLMLVQAAVMLARGSAALIHGGAAVGLLERTSITNLSLLSANLMVLLLSVGFIMVAARRLQSILEQRATLDPLTGVLNRRGFGAAYARAQADRRGADAAALMTIDLDHFKSVNDRFGHAMGDRVLVDVAGKIAQALRAGDCLARFGGEEFVILLPATRPEQACQVAMRIQAGLRQPDQRGLPACTVSIGIAGRLDARETLDELLSRSDAALYRAKANGRNRIELAGAGAAPLTAVQPACAVESDSCR